MARHTAYLATYRRQHEEAGERQPGKISSQAKTQPRLKSFLCHYSLYFTRLVILKYRNKQKSWSKPGEGGGELAVVRKLFEVNELTVRWYSDNHSLKSLGIKSKKFPVAYQT